MTKHEIPLDRSSLERVAAVEHEQWAHWTRYMLDNLSTEDIRRWRRQIDTPYEDLTELEKSSDREWAAKAIVAWLGISDD